MCKINHKIPETYAELIEALYKPFPVTEMKLVPQWKGASSWNPFKEAPQGRYFTSIESQAVKNRLNECFGLFGWEFVEDEVRTVENDNEVVCRGHLTVTWNGKDDAGQPITFTKTVPSVGGKVQLSNDTLADTMKGARTAAISKAASELGIGDDVFSGEVDYDRWLKLCHEAGIRSLADWKRGEAVEAGSSEPKSANKPTERKPVEPKPAEKPPEKKTGKLPLTKQLFTVSKILDFTDKERDQVTRQALNISSGAVPLLKDIDNPTNQKKVLAYLLKFASEKYVATGVLNEFLREHGCETVSDFLKKDAEISDIELLFERMTKNKNEAKPLPPTPTTDQLISAYKESGFSVKDMEASVQKSVQYWETSDKEVFARAYREAQAGKYETIGAALAAILD